MYLSTFVALEELSLSNPPHIDETKVCYGGPTKAPKDDACEGARSRRAVKGGLRAD